MAQPGGGGTGGTYPLPHRISGGPQGRHAIGTYIIEETQNTTQQNQINRAVSYYSKCTFRWEGHSASMGAHIFLLLRFSAFFFKKLFIIPICQMKWPKFEEKIEIRGGGLEKLGALRMVCPPPIANVWVRP